MDTTRIGQPQAVAQLAKASPFVLLNDTVLDRLVAVSRDEPSVADMVIGYRQSLETMIMYSEILAEECTHYEIPLVSPVV